jgi:hypothetical protein
MHVIVLLLVCWICNLSHDLIKALEYKRHLVKLNSKLSSLMVRVPSIYLRGQGALSLNPNLVTLYKYTVTHIILYYIRHPYYTILYLFKAGFFLFTFKS